MQFLGLSALGARQIPGTAMLPLDPDDGYRTKILMFGGTLQLTELAIPFAEIADLGADPGSGSTTEPAGSHVVASMNFPRFDPHGVLLPDGNVLAIGGTLDDTVLTLGAEGIGVMPAEEYDPRADSWKILAAMTIPRSYHSSATLLPDGRVLAGGGVSLPISLPQVVRTDFEIYDPPYLFRGPRPSISSAPPSVTYGTPFSVVLAGSPTIDSVVLIRAGATTHAFDTGLREIKLKTNPGSVDGSGNATLSLVSPPDPRRSRRPASTCSS